MGLTLPNDFVEQVIGLLGSEEAFTLFQALDENPPVSIRFNKLKPVDPLHFEEAKPVLWDEYGRFLASRPSFTYDPIFHAGGYYVQETSSMLIGYVIEQVIDNKNIQLAIDLCAAPGGKTTQMLSVLPRTSFVIANEVTANRVGALRHNLQKWGYTNVLVTHYTSNAFAASGLLADLVLVDAPCSGEGLFRKDPNSVGHWSVINQQQCMLTQQKIMNDVHLFMQEGGVLIYSTCTFHSGENIDVVEKAVKTGYFESIPIDVPSAWNITQVDKMDVVGYQCFPHKTNGEGFFFAALRRTSKRDDTYPRDTSFQTVGLHAISGNVASRLPHGLREMSEELYVDKEGNILLMPLSAFKYTEMMSFKPLFELGQLKGDVFLPAHGLAMVPQFNETFPKLDVDYEQAIKYLKRTDFHVAEVPAGIYFITFQGLALGLAKVMPHRTNNYLPMNRRILK